MMKKKNSKLNDPDYFDSLSKKMMDYADEHPHGSRQPVLMYSRWFSVAAVLLLGIITIIHYSREHITDPTIAVTTNDTPAQVHPSIKSTAIDADIITTVVKMNPVQMSALEQLGADNEVFEEIIPLENNETEVDLLDEITEEELDELLNEYT